MTAIESKFAAFHASREANGVAPRSGNSLGHSPSGTNQGVASPQASRPAWAQDLGARVQNVRTSMANARTDPNEQLTRKNTAQQLMKDVQRELNDLAMQSRPDPRLIKDLKAELSDLTAQRNKYASRLAAMHGPEVRDLVSKLKDDLVNLRKADQDGSITDLRSKKRISPDRLSDAYESTSQLRKEYLGKKDELVAGHGKLKTLLRSGALDGLDEKTLSEVNKLVKRDPGEALDKLENIRDNVHATEALIERLGGPGGLISNRPTPEDRAYMAEREEENRRNHQFALDNGY